MSRSRHFLLLSMLLTMPLAFPRGTHAAPIGMIERYALADDRTAILQGLIPGSEEYYFYHCLHFQVTGDVNRAETFLADWEKAVSERRTLNASPALIAIRDRQRLLTYGASPDRTIDYLRQRLGVDLNHTAPPQAGQRQWPDTLDNAIVQPSAVIANAFSAGQNVSPIALNYLADLLLDGKGEGLSVDFTWLSQQIQHNGYPRLGELAIAELRSRPTPESRQFGDRTIHAKLTLAELQAVSKAFPELAASDAMISETLIRLRADEDTDIAQQADVRLRYLQRVDEYCQTLPESQNSLKAASLYRLLEAHWMRGEYKKDLFLRYLKLPRLSPIVFQPRVPTNQRSNRFAANLGQDYTAQALLPPIGDEQPLVRAHLEHFLKDADSINEFEGLVNVDYLKRIFAETKLLYGVGEPNQWYNMLTVERRQELTDAIELTLSPVNPRISDPSAPAVLEVDLKHVDELMVRVYEINSEAYYRTHEAKVDTDIDLDGLVATSEQRFDYKLPAIRRHHQQIELPQIEGRGVWVVDLLGGGMRARAILRRGSLQVTQEMTVNGQQFTVLNEQRQPVANARMMVAGQEWLADDQGQIVIPPTASPLERTAVLMDDNLAVPVKFTHQSENYALTSGLLLNRQQLVPGQMAGLVIRPRLTLNGIVVDPKLLEDVTVSITSIDHEGISTTKRFEKVELNQQGETGLAFRVPNRVSMLVANVTGRLNTLATGESITVTDARTWEINGIDKTLLTSDIHLTRDGETWVAEVRGLSGEPIPGAGVQVTLHSIYSPHPVEATLETNANGQLILGPLTDVAQLTLASGEGARQTRWLEGDAAVWPSALNGTSDQPLQLPLASTDFIIGTDVRLVSTRSGRPTVDLTQESLRIEHGQLIIEPLQPGDYRLVYLVGNSFSEMPISITEGPTVGDLAAGKIRRLELNWPEPVAVESVENNDQGLTIQLAGDTTLARVHIIGSRYLNRFDPLALPAVGAGSYGVRLAENGYVSDLRLGEEYLYVLRRQYAKKYPGVMLPQPSLLIAPWVTDETNTDRDSVAAGDAPPPASVAADAADHMMRGGDAGGRGDQPGENTQNLAFLPNPGVLLTNLRPDAEGRIQISADALAGNNLIRIVVVDPLCTVERTVARSLPALEPRDLSLAHSLPPQKSLAFQRGVLIAGPQTPLRMDSIGTAQIQVYRQVNELLQLYQTLAGDARLNEFIELGKWNRLDDAAKQDLYGRLACHELHVFLKAKDPEFFQKVVRPYLENKKEKKLVDHWLLDRDLTPWTELWQYAQLNAFEKAILARAVPGMRESVIREMTERLALIPNNPDELQRLVETGLEGKSMEELGEMSGSIARFDSSNNWAVEGEALSDMAAESAFGMGGMGGYPGKPRAEEKAANGNLAFGTMAAPGGSGMDGARRKMAMGRSAGRGLQLFQQLDTTKQWADNHWDRVRVAETNESLIALDPFWLAWAQATPDQAFVSEHLLRPSQNRHAVLIALALLDLPFESKDVELPSETDGIFQPPHPVAIISKRLQGLEPLNGDPSLLVGQRFEAVNSPAPGPNDTAEIMVAPEEFLTGRAYRGQIVLTNPTPQPRVVDCLWQIPQGSLPVAGSQATDSITVRIEPYQVQQITYQFYFPKAGTFIHYPICVSSDGTTVARAAERTFNVVETATKIDEASWEQVARSGSAERIQKYLQSANLRNLDWSLVLHRLRDRAIYDVILSSLETARLWVPEAWAYSLLYRDQTRMKSYLENRSDLVASVGPVFQSTVMEVQPIPRGMYEHLEYAPLVPARIHPMRQEPEILNDRFLSQYVALMRVISFQKQPNADQQLALCYYLLLQNRIEEAIAWYLKMDPAQTSMQLQYDYLGGYLALHQGDLATAQRLADKHSDHPVPRWNQRFTQLQSQLRQRQELLSGSQLVNNPATSKDELEPVTGIRNDAADLALLDRDRRQSEGAVATTDVRIRMEGDHLMIDYRNAKDATLRFYGVDLELMFSKNPFVREGLERLATVRPSRIEALTLASESGTAEYRLDDALARQIWLVEVVSGAARSTTLYYGGQLKTYVSEGFGQLQVSDRSTGHPVSTAYVKVYSRGVNGEVTFHKDGYTDMRGRFDYATFSGGELSSVQKFSILVLDPERGATMHEASPPTR